jgi:hypothetical protein
MTEGLKVWSFCEQVQKNSVECPDSSAYIRKRITENRSIHPINPIGSETDEFCP